MAGTDERIAILRGVPLFAELDDRSLEAVAVLARERTAMAGEVLMRQGEPGDEFIVIAWGTVRVTHSEHGVRSLTAGGFLGEIALVERRPRTASATCVTDCRLLTLGNFEFDRLMATFPEVRARVLAAVARRPAGSTT